MIAKEWKASCRTNRRLSGRENRPSTQILLNKIKMSNLYQQTASQQGRLRNVHSHAFRVLGV
ncbi:hypothetical protein Scep_004393 [Stephania cephalantha]|uniref:Uncharacterized protein n=1 Tax=Stephania cephalantha TaxID=152367 RepID=A0AAP0KU07_9MAGN